MAISYRAADLHSAAAAQGGTSGWSFEEHGYGYLEVSVPHPGAVTDIYGIQHPAPRIAVFRREPSRAAADFGPMALVRVAPQDEWTRIPDYQRRAELPVNWPAE